MVAMIIILSLLSGMITYLIAIDFGMVKTHTESIPDFLKKNTPRQVLKAYTPDKEFDILYIRLISKFLFFIWGIIGLIFSIIIHKIIYMILNSKSNEYSESNN